MERRIVAGAITALLLLLFVYTASSKLIDMERFQGNMYNQDIPRSLAQMLVWAVPASEIWVSGCLLFDRSRRLGLISSLILFLFYTFYIGAILLHFFQRTPCPCGGVFHGISWEQHFWFNLACIGLTITALILDKKDRYQGHLFIHQ